MRLESSLTVSLLLLGLGLSLLWVGGVSGGPESDTVYSYTAYEVTGTESGVRVTNVVTGETADGPLSPETDIDGELVCDGDVSRACHVTYLEFQGKLNLTFPSRYRYAYLNGTFYDIKRFGFDSAQFERLTVSEALSDMAMPAADLTDTERAVIEDGQRHTTKPLPNANELVVADGTTYTILQTGSKQYSGWEVGSPSCPPDWRSCEDGYRFRSLVGQLVLTVLGAVGTTVGAFGVVRSRDDFPTFWRRSE